MQNHEHQLRAGKSGGRGRLGAMLGALFALTYAAASSIGQVDPSVAPEEIGEQDVARRYAVEFIVFVYADQGGSEVFAPEYPAVDSAIDAGAFDESAAPADGGFGEELVPEFGDTIGEPLDEEPGEVVSGDSIGLEVMLPEERSMQATWDKLARLDAYRPVLWSGWTQAVREEAATPAIPLRRLGAAPLELDGTLKLYLSRYLHLVVNLALEDQVAAAAAGAANPYGETPFGDRSRFGRDPGYAARPTLHYRIDEDRIVRSDELRYFDHPKFGVIARITRIDEPAADTTDVLFPAPRRTPAQRPN
ncbi:MAG: peptidoglycan binding protein CsiV [Gammaproteobacteria bacterium]|nr:peptidoglycan binding protein CsiV [Gammaproteobacteria bacterium]MDH4252887.1 peptidoglycan binding protein CsiV [Gammaproteobacteria bacterium]MDH5308427.1 peptidoglycan binding protein CsiV [Gammaproteobacteria bacterium]